LGAAEEAGRADVTGLVESGNWPAASFSKSSGSPRPKREAREPGICAIVVAS
jgi:hypothetical protein